MLARKMRTCDAAVAVLKETCNSAVMWGDSGLLDEIAIRAGISTAGRSPLHRWRRVLNNLSRCHDGLAPGLTHCPRVGNVRIFRLVEADAPD